MQRNPWNDARPDVTLLDVGQGRGGLMRRIRRVSVGASFAWLLVSVPFAGSFAGEGPQYSPYVGKEVPREVFFGDTHLHTTNSPDAYLFGVKLDPDDAYRFAKGEKVTSTHGLDLQLSRPLDFLVVSDHGEYLGLMPRLFAGDASVVATEYGRMLYDLARSKETGFYDAAMILIADMGMNERKMRIPELEAGIWRDVAAEADRQNEPGVFTAFTGYEWTSMIEGNNLHRIVIYKGDAEVTGSIVPPSSFDSPDPEDLWASMAAYEKATGDDVLAIPHNGNLSNGNDVPDATNRRQRVRCGLRARADSLGAAGRGHADQRRRGEPSLPVSERRIRGL